MTTQPDPVSDRPRNEAPAPSWRDMTPDELRAASLALGCDPEDTTEREKAMLSKFIAGGGNVWAL